MGFEANVRKVVPYVPGEQPKSRGIIKLNTNEFPYSPAPAVKKALEDFDYDNLRLYPDPAITNLVGAVADTYGLKPENVFVGVGSDDVLAMAFLTFFNSDKRFFDTAFAHTHGLNLSAVKFNSGFISFINKIIMISLFVIGYQFHFFFFCH